MRLGRAHVLYLLLTTRLAYFRKHVVAGSTLTTKLRILSFCISGLGQVTSRSSYNAL